MNGHGVLNAVVVVVGNFPCPRCVLVLAITHRYEGGKGVLLRPDHSVFYQRSIFHSISKY